MAGRRRALSHPAGRVCGHLCRRCASRRGRGLAVTSPAGLSIRAAAHPSRELVVPRPGEGRRAIPGAHRTAGPLTAGSPNQEAAGCRETASVFSRSSAAVARLAHNQKVVGSSPASATISHAKANRSTVRAGSNRSGPAQGRGVSRPVGGRAPNATAERMAVTGRRDAPGGLGVCISYPRSAGSSSRRCMAIACRAARRGQRVAARTAPKTSRTFALWGQAERGRAAAQGSSPTVSPPDRGCA